VERVERTRGLVVEDDDFDLVEANRECDEAAREIERRGPLYDGMWSGSPCLIVGGGPSLRGFDWERLAVFYRCVIATNRAGRFAGGLASVWLGMDRTFWKSVDGRKPSDGLRVWVDIDDKWPDAIDWGLPCAAPKDVPNRHSAYAWGKTLAEGVGCGGHSGFAALNLADVLGADPIYLLGFDLRGENGKTANWHDGYTHSKPANESVYDRYLESFRWASERVRGKVVVLEVEKGDSRLDCFPKALARDVL
jgi:hypothetical protein